MTLVTTDSRLNKDKQLVMPTGSLRRKKHRISQDTGIEEKHCRICNTWKPLEAFSKKKYAWDNLRACCKLCDCARAKKRQRELYATEEGRERRRAIVRKSEKKRRMNGKRNAYDRAYQSKRRKNDPVFRLRRNVSSCISAGLRAQSIRKKPGKTKEFLGCSYAELMDHLESLFQPGMTRKNYGPVWHDDHIVPRAAFGGTREELMIVNWYKNMQPMFANENKKKGAKFKEEDKIALIESYNEENKTNYMQDYLEEHYKLQDALILV